LEKSNGKPHPSHLDHPSFLCPPPYHNLFDTLINNITSLFFVKLNPFHLFNFIIQELHAFHGLLNGFVIQPYTTSDYLHVWTALCINKYYCHNVANIVMVSALLVFQFCHNLNLGLVTKVRACKGAGQERSWGVTFHTPGSAKECEGMNPRTPKELPLWELESRWTPESSQGNCRNQNPMDWGVIYIIGKLLKRKCLKWAHMTHLDI
jgi:hypothetical protein